MKDRQVLLLEVSGVMAALRETMRASGAEAVESLATIRAVAVDLEECDTRRQMLDTCDTLEPIARLMAEVPGCV